MNYLPYFGKLVNLGGSSTSDFSRLFLVQGLGSRVFVIRVPEKSKA